MEIQAIARAIRLGQDKDKDVEVFRYIIKDTVEGVSLCAFLLTKIQPLTQRNSLLEINRRVKSAWREWGSSSRLCSEWRIMHELRRAAPVIVHIEILAKKNFATIGN